MPTRIFTPARIVALALIALAIAGLAWLRFAPADGPVSVPKGAHGGQLRLNACHYDTDDGSYAADCGTLVVPENRADPHSRLIALPVIRIRARSAHPQEPVFRLEGGPGLSNMHFAKASRLAQDHDVVLVGYRGVDGSVRLDCPEVVSALKHSTDLLGKQSMDAYVAGFRRCAARLDASGVDLAGYTLPQRVEDFEAARAAFGYRQIDLVSESAGTRTALIYAARHPASIHRSVMIGVNPPGHFVWDGATTDRQIERYSQLCAKDASCGATTSDLAASMRRTAAHMPDHWWFLPIKPDNVRIASFYGLDDSTMEAAPLASPMTIDSWLSAANGDPSGFWFQSLAADLVFPESFVWGELAATGMQDAQAADAYYAAGGDHGSILGNAGTDFIWARGKLAHAWPANPSADLYPKVQASTVDTLLVSGELDATTPAVNGTRDVLPHLRNSHQVILPQFGHATDFWTYQPAASTRLLTTYLATGRVDRSLYRPQRVDFTPDVSQTALAKGLAGTMLGFAALMALSLLWMPLRVHRRGRYGRKASAALRTIWPVVLGLGGWFAAVLILITRRPGTPIDDELVACLSIGMPIGLGIHFARVDRSWTRRTRATGLAAATAGAVIGAWLGFNATTGLLALITAIVGAAAGANLIVLALDLLLEKESRVVSRDEHESDFAPTTSRHSRPSVDLSPEGGMAMSLVKQHSNLAARMGRWSASHWKTATFGWLALMVIAFAIGGVVGTKNVDPATSGPGESGRMDRVLAAGFSQPAAESVLIQSRTARAGTPAFDAAVRDVVARVTAQPAVEHVRSPLASGNGGQISKDGHSALVQFQIRGKKATAGDRIDPVVKAVAAAQAAHPGMFIGEFGDASAVKAVDTAFANDLTSAGALSIPLTLIILVAAFGALVAAGIPLLLALTAVFTTMGLLALPSHLMPIAQEASAVVLLVGLAVGVDYSMFYLQRERAERAAGRSERAALEAAAATSGRSVLISGLTVMVAMAGMFLTRDATFASFGLATMFVVLMAMVGSLTVLPALLGRFGDGVDRLRVPFIGRLRRGDGDSRIWGGIVERVLRRPLVSALIAGGVLVALAVPALQLRMATPGPDTFPQSLAVVKSYDRMQQAFPGTALPANVVVQAPDVTAPAVRQAIGRLESSALATGFVRPPITIDTNAAHTIANITVPVIGGGTDARSIAALKVLRTSVVPNTVGAVPNVGAGVTGTTAEWIDQQDQMRSTLPLVVGFVLVFAFTLMLIAFRSIVVAIKAIVLNLLSVGAAYGVLVLVFQHGIGKGVLGFSSTAGIAPIVPMLLFVILFGLSMDYHVFIVSRIREAFDRGESMDESIATGIRSTAGVVTSAAVVMVAVFSIFATLSMLMFKQFGVGLAVAVLLDATLVRGVLLPASMKLLGERNWYLPSWLGWLPRLEHEAPAPMAEPTPALSA